jgi:hypothetical protein
MALKVTYITLNINSLPRDLTRIDEQLKLGAVISGVCELKFGKNSCINSSLKVELYLTERIETDSHFGTTLFLGVQRAVQRSILIGNLGNI